MTMYSIKIKYITLLLVLGFWSAALVVLFKVLQYCTFIYWA